MQKRGRNIGIFILFFILSLLIFALSKTPVVESIESLTTKGLIGLLTVPYTVFSRVAGTYQNTQLENLKRENRLIIEKFVNQKILEQDLKALSDQFQTVYPRSQELLPAKIVGAPSFIPGVLPPEILIIDKGEKDNVRVGDAVVFQNNLVGKVIDLTPYLSKVILVTGKESSFTAKTVSKALGIVKGQDNGQMILDNVLLSETLSVSDVVVTKGDLNINGNGISPDLVIGKITSLEKKPSALFQRAQVKSLIDFSRLSMVFVVISKK